MKRFPKANAVACSIVLVAGLMWTAATSAGETPKKIRIIYTNDTLGYLEPCG